MQFKVSQVTVRYNKCQDAGMRYVDDAGTSIDEMLGEEESLFGNPLAEIPGNVIERFETKDDVLILNFL